MATSCVALLGRVRLEKLNLSIAIPGTAIFQCTLLRANTECSVYWKTHLSNSEAGNLQYTTFINDILYCPVPEDCDLGLPPYALS